MLPGTLHREEDATDTERWAEELAFIVEEDSRAAESHLDSSGVWRASPAAEAYPHFEANVLQSQNGPMLAVFKRCGFSPAATADGRVMQPHPRTLAANDRRSG